MVSFQSTYGFLSALGALQTVVLCTLLAVVLTRLLSHLSSSRYADIPRLREPKGKTSFSLRTRLAYYTDSKQLFREAYENASTKIKYLKFVLIRSY